MRRIEVDDQQFGRIASRARLRIGEGTSHRDVVIRSEFPQRGANGRSEGIVFLNKKN